jgi:cytochrome c oxidase subunit 1
MNAPIDTLPSVDAGNRLVDLPGANYINNGYGLKSWLLTKDHKRIAILYLVAVSAFFALGGIYAGLIRLELLTPQSDMVQPATYNKLFTHHGIIMVFFFLIPSIPAILGNFLIPLMIGAKDLALPKINLLSWYIYMAGGVITLGALIMGGVDTGWTFYVPYSTSYSNGYVMATGIGIFINGFSSILTGLNFIVTIHTMRAPGMTWFRMPLFCWSHYATSLIMILGTPVIAITILLMAFERATQVGIFDPELGGDPILFQHLVLVLLAPCRLYHALARHGRDQRVDRDVFAQKHFRLQVRRLLVARHRGLRIPDLGTPHVHVRTEHICRSRLLVSVVCSCSSVGN